MWNAAKTTSRPKWRCIAKPYRYPVKRVRQVGLPGGSPMAPTSRKAAEEKIAWWPVSAPIFNRVRQPPLLSPARASQTPRPRATKASLLRQLINRRYRQASLRRRPIARPRPQTRISQSLAHLQVIDPQVINLQVIDRQPIELQGTSKIGHSAHQSRGGSVAATPLAA